MQCSGQSTVSIFSGCEDGQLQLTEVEIMFKLMPELCGSLLICGHCLELFFFCAVLDDYRNCMITYIKL